LFAVLVYAYTSWLGTCMRKLWLSARIRFSMLAYSRWQFGCKGRIVQFEYCRIDTAGKTDHHGRLPAEKGIPANFISLPILHCCPMHYLVASTHSTLEDAPNGINRSDKTGPTFTRQPCKVREIPQGGHQIDVKAISIATR